MSFPIHAQTQRPPGDSFHGSSAPSLPPSYRHSASCWPSQLCLRLPTAIRSGDNTRSNAPAQHIHIGHGGVLPTKPVPPRPPSPVRQPAVQQLPAHAAQLNQQLQAAQTAPHAPSTPAYATKDDPAPTRLAALPNQTAAPSHSSAAASPRSNFAATQRAQEAMLSFMPSSNAPAMNAPVVPSPMPNGVLPHPSSFTLADCLRQPAQMQFPPRRPTQPPLRMDQVCGASAEQVRQLCLIANEAATLDGPMDDFLYRARSFLHKKFFTQLEQHMKDELERERRRTFGNGKSKKRARTSKTGNGAASAAGASSSAAASAASSSNPSDPFVLTAAKPSKKSKPSHPLNNVAASSSAAPSSHPRLHAPPRPEAIIQHYRNLGAYQPATPQQAQAATAAAAAHAASRMQMG
jgi:hypothetical protein